MKKSMKIWLSPLFAILLIYLGFQFRTNKIEEAKDQSYHFLSGTTMGKIKWVVKYKSPLEDSLEMQHAIDSLLIAFNQSLSTYIPTSEISFFNNTGQFTFTTPWFKSVMDTSKQIYQETDGAFNPAIGPLIDFWGFGAGKMTNKLPDSAQIDSLLVLTDFEQISWNNTMIKKDCVLTTLNLSAIAKGQAVDVLFDYAIAKGINDVYVEIGGECRARGLNPKNKTWRVGIQDPHKTLENGLTALELKDMAIATSGNYRNNRLLEGKRIVHSIDPNTGYSVESSLLSASVIANNCMRADAYATAFMVMGVEKTKAFIDKHQELGLGVYLIYDDAGGYHTYSNAVLNQYLLK